MLRRFSIDFAIFSIGLDAIMIATALAVATNLRPSLSSVPFIKFIPSPLYTPFILYLIFPLLWVLILFFSTVYDGRRNLRIWRELASLTGGSILAIIAMAGVLYLSYREVSRVLFLAFGLLAFLMLLAWRLVVRLGYRMGILKSVQPRRILIAGNNSLGHELEKQVLRYNNVGLQVVGFVDDIETVEDPERRSLDSLANINQAVKKYHIDDVVIALSSNEHDKVSQVVNDLSRSAVKVFIIPDYFKLALYKTNIEEFAGLPMLDLRAPALSDGQRLAKRAFDLTICLVSLPLNLILMGFIALGIRLDSPGPIFFRQTRVGENGRLFRIYKFRTMVSGVEDSTNPIEHVDDHGRSVYKIKDDPRVTRIGRFLRKTSLDEVPQIFNVIKGDMSLVGPRPELPSLVDRYQNWQHKRFCVLPGVTGWWQVTGRSDKPMHLNTEDDLYYIENYSIIFDLMILIKTIGVVIRGQGAF